LLQAAQEQREGAQGWQALALQPLRGRPQSGHARAPGPHEGRSVHLSERERERIERALDAMYDIIMDDEDATGAELLMATRLYVQAVGIVRERPPGDRKVRSDFMHKRGPRLRGPKPGAPQQELLT
jgi:hypothetical protein